MLISRAVAASMLALTLAAPTVHADQAPNAAAVSMTLVASALPFTLDPPTAADAARLQSQGRFGEAADAWLAVTNAEPDNGNAWFNLGYCLHADGRLDDAIEIHKKAAEFERFRGIALYNLGCAHALRGDTDQAFAALAKSQAAGFRLRGQAEGDSDLESLRSDPRFAALLGQEPSGGGGGGGFAQKLQGIAMQISEALGAQSPELEQQFAVVAERVAMHVQRALQSLLESMAQDDVVAPVLVKLGMLPPEVLDAHAGADHGDAEQDAAAPPAARTDAAPRPDRAAAAPDAPDTRGAMMAARRAQSSGDFAAAARGFAMVLAADPDNVQARFGHAYSLHMNGEYEKAIEAHRAAAEYAPIRGISLYNLACAYALTGKTDAALEALAQSRDAGFDVAGNAPGDSDLESIRGDARFEAIIDG